MSNKKMIVMPPLFVFEKILEIKDRKVKATIFIPDKSNNSDTHYIEVALGRMKFFDIVGWCTNQKGYQRGSHRMRKIFDLYTKRELDLLICNSKADVSSYDSNMDSFKSTIVKRGIPIYCIKDCILLKNGHDISLW